MGILVDSWLDWWCEILEHGIWLVLPSSTKEQLPRDGRTEVRFLGRGFRQQADVASEPAVGSFIATTHLRPAGLATPGIHHTMLNIPIKRGKQARAQRICVYGPEGIGKSTLASYAPKPLFLDTEMGTGQLEVDRVEVEVLDHISYTINEILNNPGEYQTVVLDTADNLWRLCADSIVAENKNWKDIESPGYGKGYAMASDRFRLVLAQFDRLINAGVNVVIVSHAKVTTVNPPDNSEYSKYCIKVSVSNKQAEASRELMKEWCDCLLFCNFDTVVDSSKGKACKHERAIYTTCAPAWEAKNRYSLPEKMPMTAESMERIFATACGNVQQSAEQPAPAQVVEAPAQTPAAPVAAATDTSDEDLLVGYFTAIGKLQLGQGLEHLPEKIAAALKARPENALAAAKKWHAERKGVAA